MERLSDLNRGDRVRLVRSCRDIRHPETFEPGLEGTLGQLYRVQDSLEIWEVILDKTAPIGALGEVRLHIAVSHLDVERT